MLHGASYRVARLGRCQRLPGPHLNTSTIQPIRWFRQGGPIMASNLEGGQQGTQNLKKRAVAGSFLFRYREGDRTRADVALFRRSGEVRTYQHKLAPISGSVEKDDANPLATALREIKEETGLDATALELLRVGKPYSFIDEAIGREWTINPFAFRLKDITESYGVGEKGIVTDWEHEGWEWYEPLQVNASEGFGGVPRLVDSLRRVWPEYDLGAEAGATLTTGLDTLRNDHESGARQLAGIAILTLREVISKMDSSTVGEKWWADIRMAAWHLCKNGRESMGAAITSALVATLHRIESVVRQDLTSPEKREQILKAIDEQIAQRQTSASHIQESLVTYLRKTHYEQVTSKSSISILTLSSSSTISSALLKTASDLGVVLDLRILESRPNCEGVSLAANLLESAGAEIQNRKIRITLYTDASAALAAAEGEGGVDIVLLGADCINSDADVSNKTGSLPAVLSARHVAPEVAVVILSETEKIAEPGTAKDHVVENNDPQEVTSAWDNIGVNGKNAPALERNITVKNIYFEWVPARLIDAYITEHGLWSSEDIAARSRWVAEETKRFFEDL